MVAFGGHNHSIGMDREIGELCYIGTILQRSYRKMTISWSFSYDKFFLSHNITVLYPNPCYKEVCYKGTDLYYIWASTCDFGNYHI